MDWITWPRIATLVVIALFLVMIVYGSSQGMFGSMFAGFISTGEATATPRAGTTTTTTQSRVTPSATVRR